jgi:aldehyde:ferredoxin oxidoreductase
MDIYEKAGNLLIDIAKIVIGGMIIGAIMMENTNTMALYVAGTSISVLFIGWGFFLYWTQKRKQKENKKKQYYHGTYLLFHFLRRYMYNCLQYCRFSQQRTFMA